MAPRSTRVGLEQVFCFCSHVHGMFMFCLPYVLGLFLVCSALILPQSYAILIARFETKAGRTHWPIGQAVKEAAHYEYIKNIRP